MNISDYENLPETLSKRELKKYILVWLEESTNESVEYSLEKLSVISDKQWHTYELPDSDTVNALEKWLDENFSDNQEFLEEALGASYCFGLSKSRYKSYLLLYKGDAQEEYERYLLDSIGESIDPYSSLRDQ